MSFSMSLHIGVNEVDPDTYGEVPRLRSAVKDAEAMEQIATDLEYQDTFHLHNEDATVSAVLTRIGEMALQIEPGGVAMVTYAGHGSEVPDDTGDEQSGRDQTWVLYDKMLIDDQLRAMWGRFAPGVRVFFVSDSCHSGSMARTFKEAINKLKDNTPQFLLGTRDFIGPDIPKERILPPDAALQAFSKYESEIVSTQWTCGNRGLGVIGATVISLAACQDDEVAGDGANNGVFTAALLQVWNNGQFSGSSQQFLDAIARKTRMYQRPRFEAFGASNPGMMEQIPFGVALSGVSPNDTGDEQSGRDETWVLYDKMLIDDQLRAAIVRSPRVQRAKDLLAANGVYQQGCSAFIIHVLQVPWENANALMGNNPISAGTWPNYTGLSPGNIVGWKSTSGSGHVAIYIGEADTKFIDVREPGAESRPRAIVNGYGRSQELFKSSRF
ncbi:Caspase domain protein [Symmachiella macrocystis]|uniref:Caspase domain protein n=1 Tax=Symmachiella macrocystis TaxID=2527985 RepID=A0A5C6ASJ8_9PLAN|nr:caspase family protein [Symmachiella macrocystis]TWU03023.1 Caspase domain protein [Symmachiella macrocystis]